MGPYAGVDYNLTLCQLQSRLQDIYHGRPYARVDIKPMPESTLSPQSETLHLASVLYCMWDIGDRVDMKYRGEAGECMYGGCGGRGLSDHVTYVGGLRFGRRL
jgi:hypothetical protein